MSRRPGVLLPALLLATPLAAQDVPPVTAEQVIADGKKAYALPVRGAPAECPMPKPGEEIVVCAQQEDSDTFRGPSSSDLDPTGLGAKDTIPRAPGVDTVYPGVAVASGCFIPPCPPPMPVLIDLKAIPEAPPGSDADRIARGELAQ